MTRARADLPKALYEREWLEAAAAALGGRADVALGSSGRRWLLEVEARGREKAAALLGELLNDALARGARADLLDERLELVSAVAGRLLEHGFPAPPLDPLEQLEPQVRADRASDLAALLARAREAA